MTGLVEAKLNWSSGVHDCVRKHATVGEGPSLPKENFSSEINSEAILDPEIVSEAILDPSLSLSAALGRLDSDSIWHIHVRRIYGLLTRN